MSNTFNYFTEGDFIKAATKYKNTDLSICHYNIRSIVAHNTDFNMFLQSLKFKHKFIELSETWLNESNKLLYNLHGYNSIHKTRMNKPGGGV